jgi:hypothetical protein
MKKKEHRKSQRFDSLNLSYICLDEDQQAVKQGMGRTLNLSETGILLETYFPIAAEHTVILSIGLKNRVVDLKGRLVHLRSIGKKVYEVGIEFIEPDQKTLKTVKQFLRSNSPER